MSGETMAVLGEARVIAGSDGSSTLVVPIRLKVRSGRVRLLPGQQAGEAGRVEPTALQQALIRGYRWRELLDTGQVASMSEIAQREKGDVSYVARMINLTLLAPELIEAILDDTLPERLRLNAVAINPPMEWEEQRSLLTSG